jgi:anti-sigma B factor antagonist
MTQWGAAGWVIVEQYVVVTKFAGDDDDQQAGFAVAHPTQRICVVEVSCELDMLTSPTLQRLLTQALVGGYDAVLVDLSGCEFMASGGIAALMSAHDQSGDSGIRFGLVGMHRIVGRALRASGLESLLITYPTLEEAVAGIEEQ